MNRKIVTIIAILLLSLGLTGCSLFGQNTSDGVINNITNKVVKYEEFTINDFQSALEVAIEKADQSMVTIVHSDGIFSASTSLGSGVIVGRKEKTENGRLNGYEYIVVTNRHVVMTSSDKVSNRLQVYLGDRNLYIDATCLTYFNKEDIAILSFTSGILFEVAEFADSAKLKQGQVVIAIGTPYDLSFYSTATYGIVSHPLRYLEDVVFGSTSYLGSTCVNQYIQHDSAINPGNSGGGLFDISGKLIGINTLKILSDSEQIESMGLAIPSNVVYNLVKSYI